MTTKIEWTHVPDGKGGFKRGETWNPQVGCVEVSPACRHCYAASTAHLHAKSIPQHRGLTVVRSNGVHWNGEINRVPGLLEKPLRWREPRGIFVGSMTDTFLRVDTEDDMRWIATLLAVAAACQQHTFMFLTKRPTNARKFFRWLEHHGREAKIWRSIQALIAADLQDQLPDDTADSVLAKVRMPADVPWPLPNVWIGVTAEDQQRADERVPELLQIAAAVRFVSYEPACSGVDWSPWLPSLDWLIAGGESGPKARAAHPDWFRSARDQCVATGVPFFFKQWGEWGPKQSGTGAGVEPARCGKKLAGRELDGRTWEQFPASYLTGIAPGVER